MNIEELKDYKAKFNPNGLHPELMEVLKPAAEEGFQLLIRDIKATKKNYYSFDQYSILCSVNGGAVVHKYKEKIEKYCEFSDLAWERREFLFSIMNVFKENGYTVTYKIRRAYDDGSYYSVIVSGWGDQQSSDKQKHISNPFYSFFASLCNGNFCD